MIETAYDEPAMVICRQSHPRIQGSLSKEAFYHENHCMFSGKWNNTSGFEQLAKEPIQERNVEIVTSSLAGMAMYVAQRDCLGVVSRSFAMKWSKALKLQVLDCPIEIERIPYKFVYHKRDEHNPAHQRLREQFNISWSLPIQHLLIYRGSQALNNLRWSHFCKLLNTLFKSKSYGPLFIVAR